MADIMASLGLQVDTSQALSAVAAAKTAFAELTTVANALTEAQKKLATANRAFEKDASAQRAIQAITAERQVVALTEQHTQAQAALTAAVAARNAAVRDGLGALNAETQARVANQRAAQSAADTDAVCIARLTNLASAERAVAQAANEESAALAAAAEKTRLNTEAGQRNAQNAMERSKAYRAAKDAAAAAAAATTATTAATTADTTATNTNAAAHNQAAAAKTNDAGSADNLSGALAKIGITLTGLQAARWAGESLVLGARYETLGVVLDVVGRNVGKSRVEMEGFAKSLQRTGISMVASREELARMAAATLDLSHASDIARIAQDAAVIAGVNSSEAFERIITGITTQQPRILRTIGIYVNFEAAQEKFAKAHGRRVELLTAAEKVQINLNTAMAGGAQITGAYADSMATAGKQLTSTVRYMEDMRVKLVESFQPAFTEVVFTYAKALKFVGENASVIAPIVGTVLVTALAALTVGLWSAVAASTALMATLGAPVTIIAAVLSALGFGTAAWTRYSAAGKAAAEAEKKALDDASEVVTRYTKSLEGMSVAAIDAAIAQRRLQGAADAAMTSQLGADLIRARSNPLARPVVKMGVTMESDDPKAIAALLELTRAQKAYDEQLANNKIGQREYISLTVARAKATDALAASQHEATKAEIAAAKASRERALTMREDMRLQAELAVAYSKPSTTKDNINDIVKLDKLRRDIEHAITEEEKDALRIVYDMTAQAIRLQHATEDRWEAEDKAAKGLKTYQAEKLDTDNQIIENAKQIGVYQANAIEATNAQKVASAGELAVQSLLADAKKSGFKVTPEMVEEARASAERLARQKELLKVLESLSGMKNYSFDNIGNANVAFGEGTKHLDAWRVALSDIASMVKDIGRAFGDVGKEIAAAVSVGLDFAQALRKNAAAAAALRTANATGDAAGITAAQSAKSASIATVATAYVGALLVVKDAINGFIDRARERAQALREQAKAFREALDSYLIKDTTPLQDNATRGQKLKDDLIQQTFGGKEPPSSKAVDLLMQRLREIDGVMAQNNATLLARIALERKAHDQSLELRALVAQGDEDAATAFRQQIENQKELDAALDATDRANILRVQGLEATKRATDAAAAAEKKLEESRRKVFDVTNGTRAFTDPRGAGLAALDENAARRYNDAADGAEKAAVALYNAAEKADYFARQLEADTRTTESLVGRIMGTLGNDPATENYTRRATQRQEMADAIASEMSDTNKALLAFTHFAENSYATMNQRIAEGTAAILATRDAIVATSTALIAAIRSDAQTQIDRIDTQIKDEKTRFEIDDRRRGAEIDAIKASTQATLKAIDEQIKAAQDGLKAAQDQVSALEKIVDGNQKVVDALSEFSKSLLLGNLSTLSPEQKLIEARAQFEAMAAAAAGGDAAAATGLPGASSALLEASRAYNASNMGYVADFNRVQSVLAAITAQFGATLPIDQQTLEAARQQVVGMQNAVDALNAQKESVQAASEAQIALLEIARAEARDASTTRINQWNTEKEFIEKERDAAIAREQKIIDDANSAADIEINRLKAAELEAHNWRIKHNEYWQTFLGLPGVTGPEGGGPSGGDLPLADLVAPSGPLQRQVEAQEETTRILSQKLDEVMAVLERAIGVAVVAADGEVAAVNRTTTAVQSLAGEVRSAAQGAVVRKR